MASILELQDLYLEAIVQEIMQKTKAAGLTWNHIGGTQFRATELGQDASGNTVSWDFYITKTQIGNLSYKYALDIKKNGIEYIAETDGPLLYTNRDSVVKELYETVELIVLELDAKLKEALTFVQNLPDALNATSAGNTQTTTMVQPLPTLMQRDIRRR
jgi:hypothetical protein